MRAPTVRAIGDGEEAPELNRRQRQFVKFAHKLTASPRSFAREDTQSVRDVVRDEGEVVEAANVVAGFNFANRVADGLAVSREVPAIFRKYGFLQRFAMFTMSRGIRLRMNFAHRTIPAPPPHEVLEDLADATDRARMGRLPAYFEKLRVRPHILAGQAAICKSLLEEPGLPRETILRIGYLISSLNADRERADECRRLLLVENCSIEALDQMVSTSPTAAGCSSDALEDEILRFARDITFHAPYIADEQIQSLQRHGLSDRQTLNLVLISASYNAGNRLNRALAPEAAA